MQDSICPKGWGLPINGDAQTSKSWINLLFTSYSLQDNDSTSSLNAQKTPLSLVYSGNYYWVDGNLYSRGSVGVFWSSTPYSAAGALGLDFHSTRLVSQHGDDKIYGFTIRCVGREGVSRLGLRSNFHLIPSGHAIRCVAFKYSELARPLTFYRACAIIER